MEKRESTLGAIKSRRSNSLSTAWIAWKVNFFDPNLASVRYRCIYPVQALKSFGCESLILERNEFIDEFSRIGALVFAKAFEWRDVRLAQRAYQGGVPVFADLCDNIFVEEYAGNRNLDIRRNFVEIARLSTAVTTTTESLAQLIRAEIPSSVPVVVIPDTIETKDLIDICRRPQLRNAGAALRHSPRAEASRYRMVRTVRRTVDAGMVFRHLWSQSGFRRVAAESVSRLTKRGSDSSSKRCNSQLASKRSDGIAQSVTLGGKATDPGRTLIWFGNSGSRHGVYGLQALKAIGPAIVAVGREIDLGLLVVSNNQHLFEELIAPLPIPTAYVEWELLACSEMIAKADVCLIPNSCDDFSVVKSANRVVQALHLKTPVVATYVPALESLRSCVMLDDFEVGIRTYLTDALRRERDLARADEILRSQYSIARVGRTWNETLMRTGE